jgi:hypothetical protein
MANVNSRLEFVGEAQAFQRKRFNNCANEIQPQHHVIHQRGPQSVFESVQPHKSYLKSPTMAGAFAFFAAFETTIAFAKTLSLNVAGAAMSSNMNG